MRRQIGFLIQVFVLSTMPGLIAWYFWFGMPLWVLPLATFAYTMVFLVAVKLREG